MTLKRILAAAGVLVLAWTGAGHAQTGLERNVVASGGAATSAGHEMSFTVGQPTVGLVAGVSYDLAIGFWFGSFYPTPAPDDVPTVYGLDQNYPNPFNPMTVIRFSLPTDEQVHLAIYNVRGERVCVLVDERRPAGRHEVVWDGADQRGRGVASGTYLARIESASGVLVRKMLLTR